MTGTAAAAAIIVACIALIGTIITAWLARRSAKDSYGLEAWSKLAAAHQTDLAAVRGEVKTLREEVHHIRGLLDDERVKRQGLEAVLRSAWAYIMRLNDQVRDLGGHPDAPPAELSAWMERDGVVVDRVTVSRTTVTDTRSGDQVHQFDVVNTALEADEERDYG